MAQNHQPEDPPEQPADHSRFRFPRYLLALVLVAILLYPLPFLLVRAPHYDQWSSSPHGRELDYAYTAQLDADVVILGDSTALYGLDPVRMSRELGLKTFNLPNLLPSLMVSGDLSLRQYLRHNKPPRLIVFYLSPWNLDFSQTLINGSAYDGNEIMLHRGSFADIAGFYKTHPSELLQFPFMFYRVQSPADLRYLLHPRPGPLEIATTLGHRDLPPLAPQVTPCTLPPDKISSHLALATTQRLLQRYNTPQTRAIVYLSPIPGCTNSAIIAGNDFTPLRAAPPRILPAPTFVGDGYYAHPLHDEVPEVTDQLVQAIRPLLAAPGP